MILTALDGRNDTTAKMEDNSKQLQAVNYHCPGYESTLDELISLAMLTDPNAAPTGILLSGCSGVGKSRMASLLGRELSKISSATGTKIEVLNISVKEILLATASSSFDAERFFGGLNPMNLNNNARSLQRLVIIDDLDVIISNDDETGRSTASLSSNLESEQLRALNSVVKLVDSEICSSLCNCFLVGIGRGSLAQLPAQLARVGRFEKEVVMSPPSLGQRKDIFEFWLSTLPTEHNKPKFIISEWADILAPRTAGCVASDIRRICADALTSAVARKSQSAEIVTSLAHVLKSFDVEWNDVKEAARSCVPSQLSSMDVIPAKIQDFHDRDRRQVDAREEFEMAWKNFAGYSDMKTRLFRTVVRPWRHHIMESKQRNARDESSSSADMMLKSSRPSGILFHGPPGNGKTHAAMCLASSLGLNCVKVRSSEVFSQWLGGSEATLRSIFSRARAASPCILLFDELDALAMNREADNSSASSGVQSRILTTLLNEMDGITNAGSSQSVLIVAATNRLDSIDAALLRPGRLEEHVFLCHPDSSSVLEILNMRTAKMPMSDLVSLDKWSRILSGASTNCAEVEGLCRDACLIAMRRCSDETDLNVLCVTDADFEEAFRLLRKNTVRDTQLVH
ncbi:hypothetical protein HJC23_000441 [Cyclotella cryptica]|uniref:AAA+ ATPase domain-containing protein n=1 Tax=Cyclotella cryptica TaxID=29204 RepID=A0ABD3Q9V9_9STRA|eukprot:CCRYP_007181-RA/>CCRYP_007181-RA protein AED:0.02 eAED:0.02 QI:86/1/1/1/1/1/3/55/626